jgi:hypothetical protein
MRLTSDSQGTIREDYEELENDVKNGFNRLYKGHG